jgi:hypothetical protein
MNYLEAKLSGYRPDIIYNSDPEDRGMNHLFSRSSKRTRRRIKIYDLNRSVLVIAIVLLSLVVWQCAQIGSLGGGPKDQIPPQVLKTTPENNRPNFKGSDFTIHFDEFIQLDEITQKVMISPPLEETPDFKVKGKSLRVKFKEELKPNTTYSVYFADAIVDLTERNPVMNYTYIFSTGPTVDSMSLAGTVINSFNLEKVKDVYVMLYKDNNDTLPLDSLPLAVKPYYVSKTGEDGRFMLNGLGNTEYLVFAVTDMNANYIYDQPGEQIAFLDSMVRPEYLHPREQDTALADTLELIRENEKLSDDSVAIITDSLSKVEANARFSEMVNHKLYLFEEVDTTQKLMKAELMRENTFRFSFSRPANNVLIDVVNFSADTVWYLQEISKEKDTIIWYFKDLPKDTLEVVITYRDDTLGYEYLLTEPRESVADKRKKKKGELKDYVGFTSNVGGRTLKLDGTVSLTFDQPIDTIIGDSLLLIQGEDSLFNPPVLFGDSLHRKIRFPIDIMEATTYDISFPDSTFIDWNGRFNKETQIRFKTLTPADYGVLKLNLTPEEHQAYILQMMTEKEVLQGEYYFMKDTTIIIRNVEPGRYMLKLIFDDNGNRKWDPGNYSGKRQPEEVLYYSKPLDVRGNWDIDESWLIRR